MMSTAQQLTAWAHVVPTPSGQHRVTCGSCGVLAVYGRRVSAVWHRDDHNALTHGRGN